MRIFSQSCRALFIALALTVLWQPPSRADDWPSRPIKFVVGFGPGSITDVTARAVAQELSKTLGQPVVVENKPGAGAVLASTVVARAQPDGYTLLLTAIGPAVLKPLMDDKLPSIEKDFTPIVMIGETPNIIVTKRDGRFANIKDLIAYAKRNPDKLTIGHPGVGTMGQLIGLLFAEQAGINVNFVAYQGSPPVVADIAGGHIDAGSIAFGASVKAVKILTAATDRRIGFLPNIPTTGESGLPNVIGKTWFAMVAPAGLPHSIVAKLNTKVNAILKEKTFQEKFEIVGFRLLGGTPEQLVHQIEDDRLKWSKVIAKAHLSQN